MYNQRPDFSGYMINTGQPQERNLRITSWERKLARKNSTAKSSIKTQKYEVIGEYFNVKEY